MGKNICLPEHQHSREPATVAAVLRCAAAKSGNTLWTTSLFIYDCMRAWAIVW